MINFRLDLLGTRQVNQVDQVLCSTTFFQSQAKVTWMNISMNKTNVVKRLDCTKSIRCSQQAKTDRKNSELVHQLIKIETQCTERQSSRIQLWLNQWWVEVEHGRQELFQLFPNKQFTADSAKSRIFQDMMLCNFDNDKLSLRRWAQVEECSVWWLVNVSPDLKNFVLACKTKNVKT